MEPALGLAGAEAEAIVDTLWETPEGKVVPILKVKIRRASVPRAVQGVRDQSSKNSEPERKPGLGCATMLCATALVVLVLIGMALR